MTVAIESKTVQLNQHQMHYLEIGQGQPLLFLHGMPTSSHLWREIMPSCARYGRCIAPDLMGMGQSDQPDIEYTLDQHIHYVNGLIETLDLDQIILVMHGWGSIIGFELAHRMPQRFAATAFFEGYYLPTDQLSELPLPYHELIHTLQDDEKLEKKVINDNVLIERFLQEASMQSNDERNIDVYRQPFQEPASRQVLMQFAKELPRQTGEGRANELIRGYQPFLMQSMMPKCLLFAIPGFFTSMEMVQWAKNNLSQLMIVDLGDAMHFAQESQPEIFANSLVNWLKSVVNNSVQV